MAEISRLILTLGCLGCVSLAVDVVQTPRLIMPAAGEKVHLKCVHNVNGFPVKLWYRQVKPGQPIILIGYNYREQLNMESNFEGKHFQINYKTEMESVLEVSKVSIQDNAVYYCASSMGVGSVQYFGEGTTIYVLGEGKEQINPNVTIFLPNKKEYTDHNLISLVCVASGFYPEHVRLHWRVNGVRRNDLYQNVVSNISDTFFTSKRLTLTRSEYFNQKNTFKCEAGFIGDSSVASAEIRGESACGVSEETYTMYINQGKISYIMVLFKSGLYALIVLAIIWRRKVLSGSC